MRNCSSLGYLIFEPQVLVIYRDSFRQTNPGVSSDCTPARLSVLANIVNRSLRRSSTYVHTNLPSLHSSNLTLLPDPISSNNILQVIPPRLWSPSIPFKTRVFQYSTYWQICGQSCERVELQSVGMLTYQGTKLTIWWDLRQPVAATSPSYTKVRTLSTRI